MTMLLLSGTPRTAVPSTEETAPVIDQAPTLAEQWAEVAHSEVGGLGFLFGHDPTEHYPAPLETSPEPQLEPGQLAAMQAGASMAATNTPQPEPQAVQPRKWTFTDTVKGEVLKARDRLAAIRGTNAG